MAALLAGAVLAATSASQSNKPCTATGSNLNGGPANNVFCGTSGNDLLKGNRGNDELRGFGGDDDLEGGADHDELFGGAGDDALFGSTGTGGTDGNDRLNGGIGSDFFSGGGGSDLLELRDGVADIAVTLSCGSGFDFLDMDLLDAAFYAVNVAVRERDCEYIEVGAVNEGPNVVIARRALPVSDDGRTAPRLRCPASLRQPPRCAGTLRLQLAARRSLRRRAPRMRYSLRPGQARSIPVRLSRSDRRTFRRRGRARGVLTSVEGGEHGKKTTVQTVALRRQG